VRKSGSEKVRKSGSEKVRKSGSENRIKICVFCEIRGEILIL